MKQKTNTGVVASPSNVATEATMEIVLPVISSVAECEALCSRTQNLRAYGEFCINQIMVNATEIFKFLKKANPDLSVTAVKQLTAEKCGYKSRNAIAPYLLVGDYVADKPLSEWSNKNLKELTIEAKESENKHISKDLQTKYARITTQDSKSCIVCWNDQINSEVQYKFTFSDGVCNEALLLEDLLYKYVPESEHHLIAQTVDKIFVKVAKKPKVDKISNVDILEIKLYAQIAVNKRFTEERSESDCRNKIMNFELKLKSLNAIAPPSIAQLLDKAKKSLGI